MDKAAIYKELDDVGRRGDFSSHMRGHMVRLFEEVLSFEPTLVVELGIGPWCSSSFAMGKAAELCGAQMIAVDVCESRRLYEYVDFVQSDDVEYAGRWALGQSIDILMVDTDHTYDQTQREVEAWLPHLRQRCKIMFHDTNAHPYFEAVARFLRDWLSLPFPEAETFEAQAGEWHVRHYPESWGLTILERGAYGG